MQVNIQGKSVQVNVQVKSMRLSMRPSVREDQDNHNLKESTIGNHLHVPAIVCSLCLRILELGCLQNKNLLVPWPRHHMTVLPELPNISGNGWTYLSLVGGQVVVILLKFFRRPAQRNLLVPAVSA